MERRTQSDSIFNLIPLHSCATTPCLLLEWLYGLCSAKLYIAHNAQSGIPSGTKNLCASVALLAAQPIHLNIVLYDNVHLIKNTIVPCSFLLRCRCYPPAVACHCTPLLSVATTVLLSLPTIM